jgi:AcrR family transcriptional regulator
VAVSPSPRGKKPPTPKWRRRAEARPDEILDAALAEFTERGFEAARMEDVAKRAGLSKAGVYLYFESKDALLKALIASRLTPIVMQARAAAEAGAADPKAALRLVARGVAERFRDPQNFAVPRLVITISGRFPEIADFYRVNVAEVGLSVLETLIARGIETGIFRNVPTRAAARAFIGPLLMEALWTHVLRGPSALDDAGAFVDAQIDLLLEGLTEKRA